MFFTEIRIGKILLRLFPPPRAKQPREFVRANLHLTMGRYGRDVDFRQSLDNTRTMPFQSPASPFLLSFLHSLPSSNHRLPLFTNRVLSTPSPHPPAGESTLREYREIVEGEGVCHQPRITIVSVCYDQLNRLCQSLTRTRSTPLLILYTSTCIDNTIITEHLHEVDHRVHAFCYDLFRCVFICVCVYIYTQHSSNPVYPCVHALRFGKKQKEYDESQTF